MRVAIVYPNEEAAKKWQKALASELHEARVHVWNATSSGPADYAIGWAPPPDFFSDQPRLRAFFSTGAGVEHILHNPKLPRELPIVRLEDGGMGPQMVDYCRSQVLHWMQRCDEYAADQAAGVWNPHSSAERGDWPIGIFGLGVLGRQVAAAFVADGFTVNAYARSSKNGEPSVRMFSEARDGDLHAFLSASRVLIILAPLTPATQDRFDRQTLRWLPRSSYVINVARGGLLVDEAVIELLDTEHLSNAALDVFRHEPLPRQHPFWAHPKVRITPHIAANTLIGPAARQMAEKIRRLERSESVTGVVERERGY